MQTGVTELKDWITRRVDPWKFINRITILAVLVAPATVTAASTGISLREGSDVIVSARAEHITFELAGRVWMFSAENASATPLTDKTAYSRRPSVSPDASLIAYESIRDGFHQIIVMRADGSGSRQVTFGEYNHRTPSWSPASNSRLVMSSDRGGDYGLWELDLESLSLRQLTFLNGDEREPMWNADGSKLAFVITANGRATIYAVEPGAETSILLTEENQIHAPSWRPGGGIMTYVRQNDEGSQLRMLILSDPPITKPITQTETVHPGPTQWIDRENFLYAADGRIRRRVFGLPSVTDIPFEARVEVAEQPYARRQIDFVNNDNRPVKGIAGLSRTPQGTLIVAALSDLWEFAVDANDDRTLLRQLTNDAFVDTHPAVSPDGSKLAFVSDRDGGLQIWILDLESMRRRRLTAESGMALHPVWDQESASIAYLATDHPAATSLTLKQIRIDDRRVRVLAENVSNPARPFWDEQSGSFSAATDPEQKEALASTASAPMESLPLTWRASEPDGTLIIRAGRLFDGIGPGYLIEHEIVIQGNRIAEIRPWSDDQSSGQVIDARDKTVVPGFIDLSVRQAYSTGEKVGRMWLAYGVTTIRESVFNAAEAIERQESWSSGRRIGPRMVLSLRLCNQELQALEKNDLPAHFERADVALIELCASLGGELLKYAISAAHENNLPVATIAPFPGILIGADEFHLAPDSGPDDRSMTRYDIATLAGTSGKTILSRLSVAGLPGLSTHNMLTNQKKYLRLFSAADRSGYANIWSQQQSSGKSAVEQAARISGQTLFRAIATGARVAVGSGAPASPYGLGLHAELQLLTDTGLQPFQVLKMASLDAARLIGAGENLGSIHVGKLADLVIIDGDPLADIGDSANIVITVVNGRVYGLDELLSRGNRANSVGKFYN